MRLRWPTGRSPHDAEILRLAVPAFGALVAEPLYILTDTAIVGHLGTAELGGLAIASAVILTTHAVMIFLAYGTTGAVARRLGAGDHAGAVHQGVQGLWLAAGIGAVVAVVFATATDGLVGLFDPDPDVAVHAVTYLRISAAGVPAILVTLAGTGFLRGLQDTRTPLYVAAVTAVANLVIELGMVYGLGLGVAGSAWSTVIVLWGGAVVYVCVVLAEARRQGTSLTPDLVAILGYGRAGVALIVRTIALRGSFVAATFAATQLGPTELAAHQIGYEVWALLALSLDAIAIAGQALTGRALGANDVPTALGAARRMIELSVMLGVVVGAVLIVIRAPVASLFTSDPAVASLAAFVLLQVALMQPLNGVVFALDGVLIGAGDLRWLALAMVGGTAAFAVAIAAVIADGAGLGWVWGALWVLMVARAVPLTVRFAQGRWAVAGASTA